MRASQRTEAAQVGVADSGDDADVGLAQAGQASNLACGAGGQFEHGEVVERLDGQTVEFTMKA